jgi:DnaJ-class molecular chaperone
MMKSYIESTIECPECDGEGVVEVDGYHYASCSNPYGYVYTDWDECEHCNGHGFIISMDE